MKNDNSNRSDGTDSVLIELNAAATMRDGVVLRADIYRPSGTGPWPTLLTRTPYDKEDQSGQLWNGISPVDAARRGFMVVIQDVRGRHASEGAWEPGRHEGPDGADTIAWAASLPGSSGRVGLVGGSYCGNTQLMAAIEQPPALKAITPTMTWCDPTDGLVARGGAVELAIISNWGLTQGFDWLSRMSPTEHETAERSSALARDIDRLPDEGYWHLPVSEMQVLRAHDVPTFVSLSKATEAGSTDQMRVAGKHERVDVPSLFTTGWFDSLGQGTLDNYMTMRKLGRDTRLIVGPWSHVDFANTVGEKEFGVMSSRGAAAYPQGTWSDELLAFLRRHLVEDASEGTVAATDDASPVQLFVMGRNEWRNEQSWPLDRAVTQRWHMQSAGRLAPTAPTIDSAHTEFAYDPSNPVPTHGGPLNIPPYAHGPVNQAKIEARPDVLTFTSEILEHDLEVTGPVRARLHVASSASAGDWVVRLCDVDQNGNSFNLCDGILRVDSGAEEIRDIEVDMWSTSNVFLAGHRIRVQVTHSCFPRWDRNLATGNQEDPHFVTARQCIGFLGMMYFAPCTVSPGEYPDEISPRDYGTPLGLVLTLGNAGAIVFPYLYGRVTEGVGPTAGWLSLAIVAGIACCALLVTREPRTAPATSVIPQQKTAP